MAYTQFKAQIRPTGINCSSLTRVKILLQYRKRRKYYSSQGHAKTHNTLIFIKMLCVCFFHCSFVQFGMRNIDVVVVFEITIQTLRNDHAFSQPANQLECEQTDELKKKRTTANRYDLSKYCYCTLYLLYWLLLVGVYVLFLSLFYSGYCLVLKICYYYFTIILAWLGFQTIFILAVE